MNDKALTKNNSENSVVVHATRKEQLQSSAERLGFFIYQLYKHELSDKMKNWTKS